MTKRGFRSHARTTLRERSVNASWTLPECFALANLCGRACEDFGSLFDTLNQSTQSGALLNKGPQSLSGRSTSVDSTKYGRGGEPGVRCKLEGFES